MKEEPYPLSCTFSFLTLCYMQAILILAVKIQLIVGKRNKMHSEKVNIMNQQKHVFYLEF